MAAERNPQLLVVDDEPDVHYSFRRILTGRRVELLEARSAEEALRVLAREEPTAALVDVRMPGMSGVELLKRIKADHPRMPVVIMTAHASTDVTITSMREGAFDSIRKPFDVEQLLAVIDHALEVGRSEVGAARDDRPPVAGEDGEELIGGSAAMHDVYKSIGQVAGRDVAVLITGESGTGKELVASAIHRHSRRAGRPFVALNCAAVPETLLDTELFGHERGAFTGATSRTVGRFERADTGTLFLDEVGELGMGAQAKLLRVLETGEIERVGGVAPVRLDVRVIAATNRDLAREVAAGQFREDLFYRLNVVRIHLPPLRERGSDVVLLAEHFARRYAVLFRKEVAGLAPGAADALTAQAWPGNVRELENTIKRAVILTRNARLTVQDVTTAHEPPAQERRGDRLEVLSRELLTALVEAGGPQSVLDAAERLLIERALGETQGNVSRTSRLLAVNRSTLRKRMVRLGVRGG
ncbi:MAG: sigma-54 dependent transcriptional regulator [bacterium]